MLKDDREVMTALADALHRAARDVRECPRCCTITGRAGAGSSGLCANCQNHRRRADVLCVVASAQDQAAIEGTGEFSGLYHVLHGTLSPLDGIGPDALRIRQLFRRLAKEDSAVREVILATPPTVDGEATALYLAKHLTDAGVQVSRIASGIPVGGDLQYADRPTLAKALASRQAL